MRPTNPIRGTVPGPTSQPAPQTPPLDAIFQAQAPDPDPDPKPEEAIKLEDVVPISLPKTLLGLFPMKDLELSPGQQSAVSRYHEANLVLGAAGQILICAQNCPFRTRCPLFRVSKAPFGYPCPFEANYAVERFSAWLKVIVPANQQMTETERSTVATLTYLDIDELRCRNILSDAENAKLTSLVVRDKDIETDTPLAYEEVIAANSERLSKILYERMTILNAFELTPRERTRKNRFIKKTGSDLASRQSAAADKIRAMATVDAEVVEEES